MIRIRTLKYSLKVVCLFCFLSLSLSFSFFFFFFVNVAKAKTVNFDEWFESLEWFMNIISIFLNLWNWMSRRMNQTYFKWYCTHTHCNLYLWINIVVSTNESEELNFNTRTVDSLILKISWVLMSSEKTIHWWSLVDIIPSIGISNQWKIISYTHHLLLFKLKHKMSLMKYPLLRYLSINMYFLYSQYE